MGSLALGGNYSSRRLTLNWKPASRKVGSIRLACHRHATIAMAALYMVPHDAYGLQDLQQGIDMNLPNSV